jgi:hypothetical protein
LFTSYDAPDGTAITYADSNEIVMVAIADEAAPQEGYRCALLGASDPINTSFAMIQEYLRSRRNMREETDMETEFPDADGMMNTLFAVSEELADDVITAVDDYNISRPYSEVNAQESVFGAKVTAATTNYKETFSAPLGLLKFNNPDSGGSFASGDEFIIDVEAVYEM